MHAQEVARRISGIVVEEVAPSQVKDLIYQQLVIFGAAYAQVKTYQIPTTNSYPSHYIICHLPLVFLSPTSKMIFENLCLFFAFSPMYLCFCFHVPFICLHLCLLKIY